MAPCSTLLIVGDTSPDMRSQWDPGALAVPTAWTHTAHVGHTASDFGLASGGTGEALVSVGRMPVRSIDELRRVVGEDGGGVAAELTAPSRQR